MDKLDKRCSEFVMDARRGMRRMVVPFASLATQQTHEFAATLRAGVAFGASRRCKPLVVNNTTARLAPCPAPKSTPAFIQFIH